MDWVLVIVVAVALVGVVLAAQRRGRDRESGVLARFGTLTVTATELRDGVKAYPLAGLTARVEDAAHRGSVYLSINGPTLSLLREVPYRGSPRAGFAARAFAQRVNLQARQL